MPGWLAPALKWGGLAVAIVYAIALLLVLRSTPQGGAEAAAESAAPVALYLVLLAVGVVAAIAGFILESRKTKT